MSSLVIASFISSIHFFFFFSCLHTLWSNWSSIVIILHLISTAFHCHSFDYLCWSKFPITKNLISLLLILVEDLFIGSKTLSKFIQTHSQVQKRWISLEWQLNGKLLERVNSISLKVVDCIEQWADVGPSCLELECKSNSQHMAFLVLGATLFGDGFLVWLATRKFEEQLMMIAKEACFWETYSVFPLWNNGFQR